MNKKNHFIGLIAILSIVFIYCASKISNAPISGTVVNATSGEKIYLESLYANGNQFLDSTTLNDKGAFEFNRTLGDKSFYRVKMADDQAIVLIVDSTEKVILTLNADSFAFDYSVSGSLDSEILVELSKMMNYEYQWKDSLNTVFKESYSTITPDVQRQFSEQIALFDQSFQKKIVDFIRSNSSSLATLAIIDRLDIDKHFETYEYLDEQLAINYATSPYFKSYHNKFVYLSKFTIGQPVPDIVLPNPEGETTSLSSLRGKIVLIDFWASWCKPCRMENPNVVRLYNQYKDENFEIFSVSLDREKTSWLAAIEQDQMTWMHVSDLMFWQSPVVKMYNISGIPHTLLIDESGNILAKNLRGIGLANKLKEIFQ